MSDLISRQAAIDAECEVCQIAPKKERGHNCTYYVHGCKEIECLRELPSAQPELPKQFMSDDCISRSELYKKVCEAEKLARERVLDTPSDSPFPNKLNPAYTRYSAQLDERTRFKHMIADARSVQPEQRWIPCSERLPEPRIDVWCNSDMGQMVGYYEENVETWYGRDYLELIVTAWMPLPEPYREERTEE